MFPLKTMSFLRALCHQPPPLSPPPLLQQRQNRKLSIQRLALLAPALCQNMTLLGRNGLLVRMSFGLCSLLLVLQTILVLARSSLKLRPLPNMSKTLVCGPCKDCHLGNPNSSTLFIALTLACLCVDPHRFC